MLLDSPIDDRDSGVVETAKGSLLVTTFTSLAFEPGLAAAEKSAQAGAGNAWPADRLKRWQAARDRIGPVERKKELGVWMIRSTDGGVSWSRVSPWLPPTVTTHSANRAGATPRMYRFSPRASRNRSGDGSAVTLT